MTFLRGVVIPTPNSQFNGFPADSRALIGLGSVTMAIFLMMLFSLIGPSLALAANPDLETVLNGSRQRIEKLDYRVTGRLTRVEENGKRTSYKFAAKVHWFPDGLRVLSEISGPGSEKTSLLLHMAVNGHVTIEAILPGAKSSSVLPLGRWARPAV